ncbi:MAG: hypothetical protein ABL949_06975 [Fimbriimonadaceae bacterium]
MARDDLLLLPHTSGGNGRISLAADMRIKPRRRTTVLSLIALAVCAGLAYLSLDSKPFVFVGKSNLWFVERWAWSPGHDASYTEFYPMRDDARQVIAAACAELDRTYDGDDSFSCSNCGGVDMIEIKTLRHHVSYLSGGSNDYPDIPPGTKSFVWISRKHPGWQMRFKAWLFARRWVGTTPYE